MPKKYIEDVYVPTFLIVGVEDEFLQVKNARELYRGFGSKLRKIRFVKGTHSDMRPAGLLDEIVEFCYSAS